MFIAPAARISDIIFLPKMLLTVRFIILLDSSFKCQKNFRFITWFSMFSVSRKMKKVMFRDDERRRSPRILAIDASKETREEKMPVQYSRARNKKKLNGGYSLKSTSKLSKQVWKGRDVSVNDDLSTINMEWRSISVQGIAKEDRQEDHKIANGNQSVLPPMDTLVRVLETLMSVDTYDLFAEPVGDEVEGYYEIIKEPMNFAMILAKLHEGKYKNLEEFEHDVFLIPENAMIFNSSTTVYFKQARALHDLAKTVFRDLKEDPVNFIKKYAEPRRRSMRKAMNDDPFRGTLSSASGPSNPSRGSKKNTVKRDRFHSRNFSTGNRDGSYSLSDVENKRLTYLTWRSPMNKRNSSFGSLPYSSSQPLLLINREDFSYEDSLMSFVKDLGPIAQMVAKRKLSGQHDSYQPEKSPVSAASQRKHDNVEAIETNANPMIVHLSSNQFEKSPASEAPQAKPDHLNFTKTNACRSFNDIDLNQSEESPVSAASPQKPDNVDSVKTNRYLTFGDFASSTPAFVKSSNLIDLTRDREDENRTNRTTGFGLQTKSKTRFRTSLGKEKVQIGTVERAGFSAQTKERSGHATARKDKNNRAALLTSRWASVARNRRNKTMRRAYKSNKGTCSFTDGDNADEMARPVILALEYPSSSFSEYKPRNKRSCAPLSLTAPPSTSQAIVLKPGGKEAVVTDEKQGSSQPQFAFNLAFLKERLSQMNGLKKATFENRGAERTVNLVQQQEEPKGINNSQPFMYNQPYTRSSNSIQPFMHNQPYAGSSNNIQPFMHNQPYDGPSNNSQSFVHNQPYAGSSNNRQPFVHNQPYAGSSKNSQPFLHNQPYAGSSNNSQPFVHNQPYAGSSNNSQPFLHNQPYAGSSNNSQPVLHNQTYAGSSNNSQPVLHNQTYAGSSNNSQPVLHNQTYAGSSNNSQPLLHNQSYAGSSLDPNLRLHL